jgi:hypothetical protein
MSDRLAEIRARLESATPGPWYVDGPHPMCGEIWVCTKTPPLAQPDGTPWHELASPEVVATGLDDAPGDADLIAHAPADLGYLLDALAAMTDRAERAEARVQNMADALESAMSLVHSSRHHGGEAGCARRTCAIGRALISTAREETPS